MRILIVILAFASICGAQNFAMNDEIHKNGTRFRRAYCELTIPMKGKGLAQWLCNDEDDLTTESAPFVNEFRDDYRYLAFNFPDKISTYRMPSCEFLTDKGKPPMFEWVKIGQQQMILRETRNETIHVSCMGYELKPWRKLDDAPMPPVPAAPKR